DCTMQQPDADTMEKRRVVNAGDIRPREVRKSVEQESQQKDDRAAAKNLPPDVRLGRSARAPRLKRNVSRDPDDEEEKRKDQVCRCPSVPLRMLERSVDRAPVA